MGEEELVDYMGKERVKKLVRDFQKWIKRLRQLTKSIWGPLRFLSSLPQIQNLEKDHDPEQVGLLDDVLLRKWVVVPANKQVFNFEVLKIRTSTFSAGTCHPKKLRLDWRSKQGLGGV